MVMIEVDTMLGKVKCNERDYRNVKRAFDECCAMKRDRYLERSCKVTSTTSCTATSWL